MTLKMASVAVVGAGICGLSSAVCILERDPTVKVTLIADKFSPNTTSDGAAGLMMPFVAGDTPMHLQRRWFKKTLDMCQDMLKKEDATEHGAFWVSGYVLYDKISEEPHWKNDVWDYHLLNEEDLGSFSDQAKFGYGLTTIILQGTPYMAHLMERFKRLGGIVIRRTLNSLSELHSFDVVVNCSGMRAREVVGDLSVEPVRGQVLRIGAPWIKNFVILYISEHEDQGRACYVIPQINGIVAGGTTQRGNFSEVSAPEDTAHILKVTSEIFPSIKKAKILKNWAGLRPARSSIRLQPEVMSIQNKKLNVVHNYGHGGSGITLHWGCALDTADLVQDFLAKWQKARL